MCKYYKKIFTCSHLSNVQIDRCAHACRTNIICSDPPSPPSPTTSTSTSTFSPTTTTNPSTSSSSPTSPTPSPVFSPAALIASIDAAPRPSHFPCFDCLEAEAFTERAAEYEAQAKREADKERKAALEDIHTQYLAKKARAEDKAEAAGRGCLPASVEDPVAAATTSGASQRDVEGLFSRAPAGFGEERAAEVDGKEKEKEGDKAKDSEESKWIVSEQRKRRGRPLGRGARGEGRAGRRVASEVPRSAPATTMAFPGVWGRARKEGE